MIEHFDIVLVTETVLRIHARTRQLLSENGTQDTFYEFCDTASPVTCVR